MKKKVLAMALAAGLCFASTAAPAMAGIENITVNVDWAEKDTDFVRFSALTQDVDVTEIYGVTITMTCADLSGGAGGGIIINADSNGWDQIEWGNADAGKDVTMIATGNADEYTITRTSDTPMFAATDTYANICLSHWWGGDIVVTDCDFLDADGNVLGEEAPADEPAVDTPITAPAETLPQTGLVSTSLFLAVGAAMMLGGAAATKKKND